MLALRGAGRWVVGFAGLVLPLQPQGSSSLLPVNSSEGPEDLIKAGPSIYLSQLPGESQAQGIGYTDSQISFSVLYLPTSGPLFCVPD